MEQPQVEQLIKKVDDFLAAYPTLCQYDRLRDLEKQTGQPKVFFVVAFGMFLSTVILGIGGMKLISDVVCFAYPAYVSFNAINSVDPTDNVQWLTYWVIFALFSTVESVVGFLVSSIPLYFVIKMSFFLWLYHPKSMGAGLVYAQVIKPFVMPHLQSFAQETLRKKQE